MVANSTYFCKLLHMNTQGKCVVKEPFMEVSLFFNEHFCKDNNNCTHSLLNYFYSIGHNVILLKFPGWGFSRGMRAREIE